MIKKLQNIKLLILFIALATSSPTLLGYSKHGNVTCTKTSKNSAGEEIKFISEQIYCHTSGLRQKAQAVFFYGKSNSFPNYSTKFTASSVENDFLEKTFSTDIPVKYDDVVFTSPFLLKIAQKINGDVFATSGSNKSTAFVINLAGKEYFVEIKQERDLFSSSFDQVLTITTYGQEEKMPTLLLSMLKTVVLQQTLENSQDGLPFKNQVDSEAFIKSCMSYLNSSNLPQAIQYWITMDSKSSAWQSPYAQYTATTYPMDTPIICENALIQKASNSFANICSPENNNNANGKQARILFVWESDLVGTGFIAKNAGLLKNNHWIIVILNDLQREFNNREMNQVWDEFLTQDNKLMIPNLIQITTPISKHESLDKITSVKSFKGIDGTKIMTDIYTLEKEILANDLIAYQIGFQASNFLKNQAFIYN